VRSTFDPDDATAGPHAFYRLLTALVVPRPVAWVSTLAADGTPNLAPHSFFSVACARPPIVSFTSVGAKDTLRNVEETGEFVVNLAPARLIEQVNNSSARFAADVSEAEALDIVLEPSERVRPARVAASPASLECRRHATIPLGDSTLVLGRVVLATVDDSVLVDGHPAYDRLDPVARLGRDEWGLHAQVVSIRRPRRPEDIQP
jgi:flavin reductase (DIM6/NTAB) family NADH-FMN oxidoreductase RutF